MKLRTSSWHVKLYAFYCPASNLPKDFCTYFWKLMFGSFIAFVAGSFALFLVLFLCAQWYLNPIAGNIVVAMLVAGVGVAILGSKFSNKPETVWWSNTKEVFRSFKDRFCPLIEWVSSEQEKNNE